MKLDVYNHIFPMAFFDYIQDNIVDKGPIKRWLNVPVLYDVDKRLKMMERFGEYQQILSLSAPTIEFLAPPEESPAVARLANDGMAALCRQHPDRFPSFIASMPMNNPDEAVKEIDRAIGELGACGIQIFSNVNGRPLDDPEFFQIFERMTQLDRPIFLHPARGSNFPDYLTEDKSEFEIWWTFGWTFETSAAMARIVFSGIFDKLPTIKIIAHHLGAMVPYVEGRVGWGQDQLGSRTPGDKLTELRESLKKRPIDYFKMFYADTATFGSLGATRCGLDFYGTDRCLFASDCPFDPEGGPLYIRETIRCLDTVEITDAERTALYEGNARKLLKLA
jgi:predicted TIM-barrel fold metal-dependent hydrolase